MICTFDFFSTWGRGEGEFLSIHVVSTQCASGLRRRYLSIVDTSRCEATSEGGCQPFLYLLAVSAIWSGRHTASSYSHYSCLA